MANQRDQAADGRCAGTGTPDRDERIDDFLDHLTGPLVGIVPVGERRALRDEVLSHLEWLIQEGEALGRTPGEAVEAALREFGDPWQTGEAILHERSDSGALPQASVLPAKAALHGVAWFGPPAVLGLLLLEWLTFSPAPPPLALPAAGAIALLGPVFAGCMTGLTLPARAGVAALQGAGLLGAASLAAGMLALPRLEVLLFGLFIVVVWAPLGWLSAVSLVTSCRQGRRYRFLKHAGR